MKRISFLLLVAGVIGGSPVAADQLRLKNGDQLTGQIAKSEGKTLKFMTAYAGEVSVALDAIDSQI